LNTQIKKNQNWKKIYWVIVLIIFIALIFMVRFVLDVSRIYIDKTTVINPYYIEWSIDKDNSLRLNDPYYINSVKYKFIKENLDKLELDTSIYNPLMIRTKTGSSLRDIPQPYLIWKKANNDTIHVLKNNILLNFKFQPLD